jgi:type II secretory pathway pseudopilin PulG
MKLAIQNKGRDIALRFPGRGAASLAQQAAFTLVETLAALLFMAIVIPVAVEALHVASQAGEVAARKGAAARIADRVLNESLIMTNWTSGSQSGTAEEGSDEFHWTLNSQNWPQDNMELLTAQVTFSAQGRQFSVQMSTLANRQAHTTPMQSTGTGTTGAMP